MRTASVQSNNVDHGVSLGRRLMGLPYKGNKEVIRSGGEDGLYRITLEGGDVVEVTVVPRKPSVGWVVEP